MPQNRVLDRLVHNAYKVELKGESMRKKRTMLDQKAELVPDSQHNLDKNRSASIPLSGNLGAIK